jgi:hypothetical protein
VNIVAEEWEALREGLKRKLTGDENSSYADILNQYPDDENVRWQHNRDPLVATELTDI